MAEKKKPAKTKKDTTSYRGKPLVRCGNVLYLGDLSGKYFSMLQIISTGKLEDLDLPQKVAVQLISNNDTLSAKDKVLKRAMKDGLYSAIDIASIWLDQQEALDAGK